MEDVTEGDEVDIGRHEDMGKYGKCYTLLLY